MKEIKRIVLKYYEVTEEQAFAQSRKPDVVFARQMYWFFASKYTHNGLEVISKSSIRAFNHTSVMYGINKIKDLLDINDMITLRDIENIERLLRPVVVEKCDFCVRKADFLEKVQSAGTYMELKEVLAEGYM